MSVEVSCVDCVKVSWQILFYVQFARWGIVDVVYDVRIPVVWPDMNALRVCVFSSSVSRVVLITSACTSPRISVAIPRHFLQMHIVVM